MDSAYIRALEQRAKWLRWAKVKGQHIWSEMDKSVVPGTKQRGTFWQTALPGYVDTLESGDTFFMNQKFCDLVEHARDTVPDDLKFDANWMQSKQGWMWVEDPFQVPFVEGTEGSGPVLTADHSIMKNDAGEGFAIENPQGKTLRVSAIGWREVPEGQVTAKGMSGSVEGRTAGKGAYQFLTFMDFRLYNEESEGFGCWSYFMLQDGDKLIDRIRQFEGISREVGGNYKPGRDTDMLHEMRWVYSAFYLMAQRLATSVQHDTDRNTRRRGEFLRQRVTPFIRVITLRRMEEDKRKQSRGGEPVEWRWQWEVRGHWRNQFYPSTNEYKQIFIEAFIKGPDDKPLKNPGTKLFVAGR